MDKNALQGDDRLALTLSAIADVVEHAGGDGLEGECGLVHGGTGRWVIVTYP